MNTGEQSKEKAVTQTHQGGFPTEGGSAQGAHFQIVTLTAAAMARARLLLAQAPDSTVGLRIGLKKGGCAGMEYTITYAVQEELKADIVEIDGIRLFIEPSAVLFLLGTEIDYREDVLSSGFVFRNPNQVSACGCGESVDLKAAETGSAFFAQKQEGPKGAQ